jgi:hypothetical protein
MRSAGKLVRLVETAFEQACIAETECRDLDDQDQDNESSQRVSAVGLGGFAAALVALACILLHKEETSEPTGDQGGLSPLGGSSPGSTSTSIKEAKRGSVAIKKGDVSPTSPDGGKSRGSFKSNASSYQSNSSQDAKGGGAPPGPIVSECFDTLMNRPVDQQPGEDRKTVEMPTADDALNSLLQSPGVIQLLRKESQVLRLIFQAYADPPEGTTALPMAKQASVTSALAHGDALGVAQRRFSTPQDPSDHPTRESIAAHKPDKNQSFRYEMLTERVVVMRRGYISTAGEGQEKAFGLSFGDFCDCIVVVAAASNPDPFAPVCPKVEKVITRLCQGMSRHWEEKVESGASPAVQELLTGLQTRSESKNKRKSVTFGGREETE